MTDIFREVDEDLRRQQYKKLADKYGVYVLAVAALIVLAVGGWRYYAYLESEKAAANGDRFVAAMSLLEQGKNAEAATAFQAMAADSSGRYPVLATMAAAGAKAAAGDVKGAVADFDKVAGDPGAPDTLRNIARIRMGYLLVYTADREEIDRRMSGLAAPGSDFRAPAAEIMGLAAWRAGDVAGTKKIFDELLADQATPSGTRERATMMLRLIAARDTAAVGGAPPAATGAPSETGTPPAAADTPPAAGDAPAPAPAPQ